MPLGKYYCDYCEKEFQDTSYARKKHIQGSHHQQSKALWYRSFSGVNFMGGVQAPVRLVNQSLSGEAIRDRTGVSWGNLPPSLRPPPEGGYPPLPFIDWG
ncbi:Zinc finger CCCH domain-containing protein 3 [Acorus calamus]|uniref:Zinc finger CCCH domain-containing protein 3 n=1 Tax=Acorus calamus TaxID=4465 RepID=A0AAV9D0J7_ACOCL|nr:Zinc finger CCCH domain-containing protein 3 [Acorus calamus]